MKNFLLATIVLGTLLLGVPLAIAAPEKTEAFVCPVLNEKAGTHNPNAVPIANGDYTVLGPNVNVPVHATNGDGIGSPAGDHAAPGDPDYSPIWDL